jgi:hypothetical protein
LFMYGGISAVFCKQAPPTRNSSRFGRLKVFWLK